MYLFSESGSYLGKTATTDADGRADLLIPEGPCKLRIDYSGTRHWTDVIHVLPHEQTDLPIDLDQLASELTHDPNPVRFDGKPPEPEPLLLASIGSLSHLLANAATAYTPPEDEVIYYYINDHLGTPQKVIDQDVNVVWAADYKPFGEVNETVETFDNLFRFPGQYFDQETMLHYNCWRFYNPKIGMYLRADPIRMDGDIDPFSYVQDNPVSLVDPLGLEVFKVNDLYDTGFLDRSPDYYSLNISFGDWAITAELDRYGNFYGTLFGGPSIGSQSHKKMSKIRLFGASFVSGWIEECSDEPPKEEVLKSFLAGWSKNISAGYFFGMGYTWVAGKSAFEAGLMTPQITFNLPYSTQIHYP